MIRVLSPDVVERIAAGEVIERPASVVKELLENSLDAGASSITVEIAGGGRRLMRVIDDGGGIPADELPLAVQRHATSKIASFDDIRSLRTLGFRGEGLSSIAAVSRLRIVSRTRDAETAGELVVDGGVLRSHRRTAHTPGTAVEVADLFYNTPARLKFLKSDSTERAHIVRTIEEYAVSHPTVAFTLTVEGRRVFSLPAGQEVRQRLELLFGRASAEHLLPIVYRESERLRFDGYVSALAAAPLNRQQQMFFVNRRPVSAKILSQAVYGAYRDALPVGRHPACWLFVTADPEELDVNVHPTKRLVRFHREQQLFAAVQDAVRSAFSGDVRGSVFRSAETTASYGAGYIGGSPRQQIAVSTKPPRATDAEQPFPVVPRESAPPRNVGEGLFAGYRYLGQISGTYLIFAVGEDMALVDQHAAHERILFERLSVHGAPGVQKLLVPVSLVLTASAAAALVPMLEELSRIGVDIVVTGERTLALTAVPSIFGSLDAAGFLESLADAILRDEGGSGEPPTVRERTIRAACRAAVKARDPLAPVDVDRLMRELAACQKPFACPHGRPTVRLMTRADLERLFLRT